MADGVLAVEASLEGSRVLAGSAEAGPSGTSSSATPVSRPGQPDHAAGPVSGPKDDGVPSCDRCRTKKVKCIPADPSPSSGAGSGSGRPPTSRDGSSNGEGGSNGSQPARDVCQACKKRGLECTYAYVYKKPGRPLGSTKPARPPSPTFSPHRPKSSGEPKGREHRGDGDRGEGSHHKIKRPRLHSDTSDRADRALARSEQPDDSSGRYRPRSRSATLSRSPSRTASPRAHTHRSAPDPELPFARKSIDYPSSSTSRSNSDAYSLPVTTSHSHADTRIVSPGQPFSPNFHSLRQFPQTTNELHAPRPPDPGSGSGRLAEVSQRPRWSLPYAGNTVYNYPPWSLTSSPSASTTPGLAQLHSRPGSRGGTARSTIPFDFSTPPSSGLAHSPVKDRTGVYRLSSQDRRDSYPHPHPEPHSQSQPQPDRRDSDRSTSHSLPAPAPPPYSRERQPYNDRRPSHVHVHAPARSQSMQQAYADAAPSPSGAGRGVSSLLNPSVPPPPPPPGEPMSYPSLSNPSPAHGSQTGHADLPPPISAATAGQGTAQGQSQGPATGTIFGSAVNTYLSGGAFDPFLSGIGFGLDATQGGQNTFANLGLTDVGLAAGGMEVGMGLANGFEQPAYNAGAVPHSRAEYGFYPTPTSSASHSGPGPGPQLHRGSESSSLFHRPSHNSPDKPDPNTQVPPQDPALPTHPRLALPFQIEDLAAWEDIRFFLNLYMEKQHVLVPLVHKPTFAQDVLKRRDKGDEIFRGLLCSLVAYTICQVPTRLMPEHMARPSLEALLLRCLNCSRAIQIKFQHLPCVSLLAQIVLNWITSQACGARRLGDILMSDARYMIYTLGFHRAVPREGMDVIERELSRRVYWSLFSDDKTNALDGKPVSLPEYESVPPFPLEVDDEFITSYGHAPQPGARVSYMSGFVAVNRVFMAIGQVLITHRKYIQLDPVAQDEQRESLLRELERTRDAMRRAAEAFQALVARKPDGQGRSWDQKEGLEWVGTQRANVVVTAVVAEFALLDFESVLRGPEHDTSADRNKIARAGYETLSSLPIEDLASNGEAMRGKVLRIVLSLISTGDMASLAADALGGSGGGGTGLMGAAFAEGGMSGTGGSGGEEAGRSVNQMVWDWWNMYSRVQYVQVIPPAVTSSAPSPSVA